MSSLLFLYFFLILSFVYGVNLAALPSSDGFAPGISLRHKRGLFESATLPPSACNFGPSSRSELVHTSTDSSSPWAWFFGTASALQLAVFIYLAVCFSQFLTAYFNFITERFLSQRDDLRWELEFSTWYGSELVSSFRMASAYDTSQELVGTDDQHHAVCETLANPTSSVQPIEQSRYSLESCVIQIQE